MHDERLTLVMDVVILLSQSRLLYAIIMQVVNEGVVKEYENELHFNFFPDSQV